MAAKKEKFIIIDGNALLHRAFHALPPLTTKDGILVNAVYGFVTILIRVMKELKPKYAAVTFDLAKPTFRHKQYEEYKATRIKQPDELYEQIPLIKQIVKAFNLPIYEKEGFEADDVIGTIVKQLKNNNELEVFIVTGDLDTLQLVNDHTKVYTLKRSINDTIIYDEKGVEERYNGLKPEQLIDFKALRGDPSDNIPGVKGIGEKTAIELLLKFNTLENLYQKLNQAKNIKPRIKELLEKYRDDAFLSKQLATIVTDVPIKFDLKKCEIKGVNRDEIVNIFQKLEFKTLLGKIPELENSLNLENNQTSSSTNDKHTYRLIDNHSNLQKFLAKLSQQKIFALDTETSSLNPWLAELVGISFCWQKGRAYFVDFNKLKNEQVLGKLKQILAKKTIKKIGHNIKFDMAALFTAGFDLQGVDFDTMVAAYLLKPGERRFKLDTLVFSEFGHQMTSIESLIGKKGKNQLSMAEVDSHTISDYACEDADYTFRLYQKLKKEIKEAKLDKLFKQIEMPLIPVLFAMEKNGVKIDEKYLNKLRNTIQKKIDDLENKIHKLCGVKFNIASPQQLKEILFKKLQIPTEGLKKIKTGISTAAGELEKMKNLHPVIPLILEYRELTKLQSTYVESLPKLINPKTGRIHTSFNQTITATGRLSSSDPNLQNIPIRTELGRKIRGAFIAEHRNKLLSADYSQIELRVVAHLSGDQNMINTFKAGKDIHQATAAYIFDVPFSAVTPEMRRKAKEVNFGILYGMGPFGLAERTGISRQEAKQFIDKYFTKYARVKQFTEEIITQARKKGYVETLFGRRRYLPEINSGVAQVRNAAERAAINMPTQGTAADIMKLAMIAVYNKISQKYPQAKLILQVHDELVLEVPEEDVKTIAKLVKYEMEHITTLKVPLVVDVKIGDNWLEMEEVAL